MPPTDHSRRVRILTAESEWVYVTPTLRTVTVHLGPESESTRSPGDGRIRGPLTGFFGSMGWSLRASTRRSVWSLRRGEPSG